MLMSSLDTYFLEVSAHALLKIDTKDKKLKMFIILEPSYIIQT